MQTPRYSSSIKEDAISSRGLSRHTNGPFSFFIIFSVKDIINQNIIDILDVRGSPLVRPVRSKID